MNAIPDYQYASDYDVADFAAIRMEEDEVIKYLISNINAKGQTDLTYFSNSLFSPFIERPNYKGLYISQNIGRKQLGLEGERKPGDIDMLVIPYDDNEIFFDRSLAIEVKVFRPKRNNPKKRPNGFGQTQINGYVEDGFPFVSTIQICMTEPSKHNETLKIKHMLHPIKDGMKFTEATLPLNAFTYSNIDILPQFAASNHMRRLLALKIPKQVGITVVGWNFDKKGKFWVSRSLEFMQFEGCTWNPDRKQSTVNLIANHFAKNSNSYSNIPFIEKPYIQEESDTHMDGLLPVTIKSNILSERKKFKRIQDLSTNKLVKVKGFNSKQNVIVFPVIGNAMYDGTDSGIRDGYFAVAKDYGRLSFEELPMFVPICLLSVVDEKIFPFITVITKKDKKSELLRLSLYDSTHDDNWVRYINIHQILKIIKCIPPEEVEFIE